jgi:hypothetical protein
MSNMSISGSVFAWRKSRTQAKRQSRDGDHVGRFSTHTRVALVGGRIMLVRVASLAAAKDLLAAQRAAERRLADRREARALSEAARIAENAGRAGASLDSVR